MITDPQNALGSGPARPSHEMERAESAPAERRDPRSDAGHPGMGAANGAGRPAVDHASVGEELAAARQAKGLTLEAVSDATRIRPDYIEAIEQMDPRRLPHGPYAAGFVRSYATFLGLDADAAVERFRREMSPRERAPSPAAVRAAHVERKPLPVRPILWTGAAILVGFLMWQGLKPGPNESAEAVPAVPEALREWVAAEPGAPDGAAALAALEAAEGPAIVLRARIPVFIEVRGPDGARLFAGELAADAAYKVPQVAGLAINARNGGAVEALRDGVSIGRLGPGGVPVTLWSVDEARRAPARPEPAPPSPAEPAPAPAEAAAKPAPATPAKPVAAKRVESRVAPVTAVTVEELPPPRSLDEPALPPVERLPASGGADVAAAPAAQSGAQASAAAPRALAAAPKTKPPVDPDAE